MILKCPLVSEENYIKKNRLLLEDTFLKTKTIDWLGTIGVGDYMMALNTAYFLSHILNENIRLNFHWTHDIDYLYHDQDPETIIERLQFIHDRMYKTEKVSVTHEFNTKDLWLQIFKWRGIRDPKKRNPCSINGFNTWKFDDKYFRETDPNKVVIWTPFENKEKTKKWKYSFQDSHWNMIKDHYLRKHEYDVVELTYRTPIQEAFDHISTCNFFICYDGMWHYIARNFFKPGIAFGKNSIIRSHDPTCHLFLSPKEHALEEKFNFRRLMRDKDYLETKLHHKSDLFRERFLECLKLTEQ